MPTMLNWFEKSAPIRLKFKVLLVILGLFTAGGIATTYLAALAAGTAYTHTGPT